MKKLAAPSNSAPSPAPASPAGGRARSFKESPVRTRRGFWPLADGYLEANVLGWFLRGIMWFVGLFMAFVLVSGAQKVAQHKMDVALLAQFIALQIPRIVVFTLPAALLFGTVSTFNEMSGNGEVTALMAGGMSLKRMLRAPLALALVLAVVAFWLQESIVLQCELRRGALAASALQNTAASQIFPFIVKDKQTGHVQRIIQADDFDAKKLILTKPDIRINQENGSSLHITAQSASWDKARGEWLLIDAYNALEPPPAKIKQPDNANFTRSHFDVQRLKTEMSLGPDDLSVSTRDLPGQLAAHNFEMVSLVELRAYRAQLIASAHKARQDYADMERTGRVDAQLKSAFDVKARGYKAEEHAATFGIHDKLATPLIVFAMVLIGAPLGVRPQRTASAGLALGLSLMVLLSYYIVWTLTSQWGKAGGAQPLLPAYLPFVILAGVGAFLTWKKS